MSNRQRNNKRNIMKKILLMSRKKDIADPLGVELITNGDFSSGETGWTFNAAWSVVSEEVTGTLVAQGANINQDCGLLVGTEYEVTYTIKSISLGSLIVFLGGSGSALGTERTTPGTYTERITNTSNPGATDSIFYIKSNSGLSTTAVFDTVSVKEVL